MLFFCRLKKTVRTILLLCLSLSIFNGEASAISDALSLDIPRIHYTDKLGYDYSSGSYLTLMPELSTAGIVHSYQENAIQKFTGYNPAFTGIDSPYSDGRGDNNFYGLKRTQANKIYLFEGKSTLEFYGDLSSGTYVGVNGVRGVVSCLNNKCTYAKSDGTEVVFNIDFGKKATDEYISATVDILKYPDGATLKYFFSGAAVASTDNRTTVEMCQPVMVDPNNADEPGGQYTGEYYCQQVANPNYGMQIYTDNRKLDHVISNLGWAIKYGSKISIINNSLEFCNFENFQCSVIYNNVRPSSTRVCVLSKCTFYDSANSIYFTEQIDVVYSQVNQPNSVFIELHKILYPSGRYKTIEYNTLERYSVADVSVHDICGGCTYRDINYLGFEIVINKISYGNVYYNYNFAKLVELNQLSPGNIIDSPFAATTVTDLLGNKKELFINTDTSQILYVKDELGREYNYYTSENYVNVGWITKRESNNSRVNLGGWLAQVINPDATDRKSATTGGEIYTYDRRGNVVTKSVYPHGGGVPLVTTASYDVSCVNSKTCNKPNWVRDSKGNQTDYTYDPAHGGVLTETEPADSNGVRPQKRYSYTQLYAKVLNASGQLINAEGPIYKLTKVSSCRIATAANPASCIGTANETITEYTYNHNNLLLTSETVRDGNSTVGATTSYGYDYVGNIIWADGPRTDVDDKIYTIYDLLRRKIFEIGADPDGTGALKRSIVKHTYDADGLETLTQIGTGNAIDGSDFTVLSFKRMTYDAAGQLIKTEVGQP